MFKPKSNGSILVRTDKDYTLFDFCDQNTCRLNVTYKFRDTFNEIEGHISGFHPESDMVSIKTAPDGYDYVIPIRNIEQIIIKGSM